MSTYVNGPTVDRPIGMFDSGVGGISVLREATRQLPHEDFIYFGDTLNAPYGTKTPDEVIRLASAAAERLLEKNVKAIVIACNTATAGAAWHLRQRLTIPVIGMEPALKPAYELPEDGLRLVLATPGTIYSEKYASLYARYGEHAVSLPCPGLMEYVEKGDRGSDNLRAYLSGLFAPYSRENVAAVVLGCTHYVFIRSLIRTYFPESTVILDGNAGTVRQLKRLLEAGQMLRETGEGHVSLTSSGGDSTIRLMEKMLTEPID